MKLSLALTGLTIALCSVAPAQDTGDRLVAEDPVGVPPEEVGPLVGDGALRQLPGQVGVGVAHVARGAPELLVLVVLVVGPGVHGTPWGGGSCLSGSCL